MFLNEIGLNSLPFSDIDECADDSLNDCHENATCVDNDGSYECHCPDGFIGDGRTCSPLAKMFPYGPSNGDSQLNVTLDDKAKMIEVPQGIMFKDEKITSWFVSRPLSRGVQMQFYLS